MRRNRTCAGFAPLFRLPRSWKSGCCLYLRSTTGPDSDQDCTDLRPSSSRPAGAQSLHICCFRLLWEKTIHYWAWAWTLRYHSSTEAGTVLKPEPNTYLSLAEGHRLHVPCRNPKQNSTLPKTKPNLQYYRCKLSIFWVFWPRLLPIFRPNQAPSHLNSFSATRAPGYLHQNFNRWRRIATPVFRSRPLGVSIILKSKISI